mmetsp:Transcript_56100/g.98409  ORF Transcript_56100/g.98409 Transcript_56100/m.98409 type:complete len:214 (+) Transcript_56100:414-1055(+)
MLHICVVLLGGRCERCVKPRLAASSRSEFKRYEGGLALHSGGLRHDIHDRITPGQGQHRPDARCELCGGSLVCGRAGSVVRCSRTSAAYRGCRVTSSQSVRLTDRTRCTSIDERHSVKRLRLEGIGIECLGASQAHAETGDAALAVVDFLFGERRRYHGLVALEMKQLRQQSLIISSRYWSDVLVKLVRLGRSADWGGCGKAFERLTSLLRAR